MEPYSQERRVVETLIANALKPLEKRVAELEKQMRPLLRLEKEARARKMAELSQRHRRPGRS